MHISYRIIYKMKLSEQDDGPHAAGLKPDWVNLLISGHFSLGHANHWIKQTKPGQSDS